ncbi:MAG: peptide ABC transporter substrate-binding protein [Lentilactobacillus diolivorans]
MKSKSTVLTLGTLSLGILLVGCTNSSHSQKEVANISTTGPISTLDTAQIEDLSTSSLADDLFEGLYRFTSNGSVKPALATKTNISDNGKTYIFNLRKKTKWSDGSTVTANNFVYGWRRLVNPKTASGSTYLFSPIKNYEPISKGKMSPKKLGIKAAGKYKLIVKLSAPTSYFKDLLAREAFGPINQNAVKRYGKSYGTNSHKVAYNGPFIAEKWNGTNNSWTLVKNKNYWDKRHVKLDKINYQVTKSPSTSYSLFKSGKLDLIRLQGEQAKQFAKSKLSVTRYLANTMYIEFNVKKGPFVNQKLRKAFSLAINRQQLTNDVLDNGAVPSIGFVPLKTSSIPSTGKDFAKASQVNNTVNYNPDLAKKLWRQGLKEIGKNRLTVPIIYSDDEASDSTMQFVQSEVEKNLPGLHIALNKMPLKTVITREEAHQFTVGYIGWSGDYADPNTFLGMYNVKNDSNWHNSSYNRLLKNANIKYANNPNKRFKNLIAAEKLLMREMPIAPIYQGNSRDLVSSNLKNVMYDPVNGHYSYKEAYVK